MMMMMMMIESYNSSAGLLPLPFLWHLSPRTIATPKQIFDFFQCIFKFEYQTIMLEVVMDLVVNEVIDKEVDKEMTKVVEEVNKK